MDEDGDDKDDSKRRTRNLSEKKRRDQFNMLVNELSSMISTNNRKMDKSTVLKSTISFLKNHNEIIHRSRAHDVQEDCKPAFLSNEEFTYLVLEALEGFIMVFSSTGQIYYVSENISPLLGHSPGDVLNKSILEFAFEEDRPNMYNLLQNPPMAKDPMQSTGNENEIRFQCHLRRGTMNMDKDDPTYELIQFNGHFRSNMEDPETEDNRQYQQEIESRLLFVCTGRLCTPQLIRDVSLVDTSRNEFTSRHSLEWKFLFLDHRAPPIIGYLPFEVLGTSGYDYYHFDDLEKIVTCHEVLMQKGELTSCYYRFLTKGQQWIWLQTRFFITYHQWNSKPEFVVCTHRVVSYADIAKSMKPKGEEMDTASKADTNHSSLNGSRSEDFVASASPSYMSEASDPHGHTYQELSQAPSMSRTMASSSASWSRPSHVRYNGSDNGSVSGSSLSSQRNSAREAMEPTRGVMVEMDQDPPQGIRTLNDTIDLEGRRHTVVRITHSPTILTMDSDGSGDDRASNANACLVPQHGMGAQYLDPAPYVGTVSVPGVLQLPIAPLPIIVSSDQAQVQLQRKHEELQQMIVRQQEELRQVKEQLLLARLGILQPLINVPSQYGNPEEGPMNQRVPAQIVYSETSPRAQNYPPQHPPNNQPHHPHMPQ